MRTGPFHLELSAPGPPDDEALALVEDFRRELLAIAAALGIAPLDAYDAGRALEVSAGYSPRSRALMQLANATAAIERLRESAMMRGWQPATIAFRVKTVVEELRLAKDALDNATAALAAE